MGCRQSSPTAPTPSSSKRRTDSKKSKPDGRDAKFEARTQAALKEIIAHKAGDDTQASFNRIILKFPALRRAFASIREVFKRFDTDGNGTIDKTELTACLQALGAHLSEADVNDMFVFSNMTESGVLSFKEFVLCLAIGSVLQLFPALKAHAGVDVLATHRESGAASAPSPATTADENEAVASLTNITPATSSERAVSEPAGSQPSTITLPSQKAPAGTQAPLPLSPTDDPLRGSWLHAHGLRLVKALRLVLEAYVLFDRDASGTIDRAEVLAMIDEENSKNTKSGSHAKRGKEAGNNALLSKDRWMELDWDGDGQITFKEFLFAFMEWVGVDDDEEEEATALAEDPLSARMSEAEIDQRLALPSRRFSSTQATISPEALAAVAAAAAAAESSAPAHSSSRPNTARLAQANSARHPARVPSRGILVHPSPPATESSRPHTSQRHPLAAPPESAAAHPAAESGTTDAVTTVGPATYTGVRLTLESPLVSAADATLTALAATAHPTSAATKALSDEVAAGRAPSASVHDASLVTGTATLTHVEDDAVASADPRASRAASSALPGVVSPA